MPEILLPAQRYDKSSRGTPRLRHPPGALHGALRLAMGTTTMPLCSQWLGLGQEDQLEVVLASVHPSSHSQSNV